MTTLAVVTLADGDCDLFPFWLEHYASLGVDHVIVSIDRNKCAAFDVEDQKLWILGDSLWLHEYRLDGEGEMRDEQERQAILNFTMQQRVAPDWILYTDLDEHHEYQGGLHAALHKADAGGEQIVMGVHCDRLAIDGSFPPLPDEDENGNWTKVTLDMRYPLRANLSRDLIGIRYCKVMAAKPGVYVRPGRHGTKEHAFAARRPGALADGHLVHHFKWRKGIIERIKDRMAKLPAEYDWYRQRYGPFLEIVEKNGGRVPMEYLK